MSEEKYPECEKLAKVSEKSQAIGDFLSWLQDEKEIELCLRKEKKHGLDPDILIPFHFNTESLLAEHFKIDLVKVENERQQIIEDIRKGAK